MIVDRAGAEVPDLERTLIVDHYVVYDRLCTRYFTSSKGLRASHDGHEPYNAERKHCRRKKNIGMITFRRVLLCRRELESIHESLQEVRNSEI